MRVNTVYYLFKQVFNKIRVYKWETIKKDELGVIGYI